jgi:hypothetical protein
MNFPASRCSLFPMALGDVIYAPGWQHCYRIMSAPFSRIHYVRWQGQLAAVPTDPKSYAMYWVKPLGSDRFKRLLLRLW